MAHVDEAGPSTPPIADSGQRTGTSDVENDERLTKIAELKTRVVGLAADAAGEVYVLTTDNFGPFGDTGRIFKLVP